MGGDDTPSLDDDMSDDFGGGGGAGLYSDEDGVTVDEGELDEEVKSMDPASVEARKKAKRIEKLAKRIATLTKKVDKNAPKKPKKFVREISEIKNK